jgi:hypothetical protein
MEDIVLGKFEDVQKEESEAGSYWQSRLAALLDNTIDKFVPSPALAYEDVGNIGGKRKVPFDIPSPFVGEY